MIGYKIRCELEKINVVFVTALAFLFLAVDFTVWCLSASPIYLLRTVADKLPVLPLWLFGLFDLLAFTLFGAALGAALSNKQRFEVEKYRGAFYFIIGVVLAYLHHVILFSYLCFFLSALVSGTVCFFIFIASINFARVSKATMFFSVLGEIWSIYVFLFSLFVFFLI